MLKLMKYEFYRRRKFLLIMLLILAFMECATIYGLYRGDNWLILSIGLMGAMVFAAIALPLVDAVANYYSDFKNTHGYMLFLTPNTGYQIIGSKALFAFVELVLFLGLVGGLLFANYHIADAFGYKEATVGIASLFEQLPMVFGSKGSAASVITLLLTTGILQYFNTIMLAMTALTLSKTLLSNKNFNWLYALLIYFGLAIAVQTISGLAMTAFGFVGDIMIQSQTPDLITFNAMKYLLVALGFYVLWIAAGYITSSTLLSKRIDL